jgi:hypothetical protein
MVLISEASSAPLTALTARPKQQQQLLLCSCGSSSKLLPAHQLDVAKLGAAAAAPHAVMVVVVASQRTRPPPPSPPSQPQQRSVVLLLPLLLALLLLLGGVPRAAAQLEVTLVEPLTERVADVRWQWGLQQSVNASSLSFNYFQSSQVRWPGMNDWGFGVAGFCVAKRASGPGRLWG